MGDCRTTWRSPPSRPWFAILPHHLVQRVVQFDRSVDLVLVDREAPDVEPECQRPGVILGNRYVKRHVSTALAGAPSPDTPLGEPGGTHSRCWRRRLASF